MFKKLLIFALFLSFIPIVQTKAIVRDSYNLRNVPFNILDTFPNNVPGQVLADTTFRSPKISLTLKNSLTNDQSVKANFIQLFIPYHPNITVVNCSKVSQFGCAAQFNSFIQLTGNNESKLINLSTIYTFTEVTVGDNVNRKGNMGWSTIIEVPRNMFDFTIDIISDLENNVTDDAIKPILKALLDNEVIVTIITDPEAEANLFNPFFELSTFMRSNNNLINASALKELIVYIDPRFSDRYTSHALSVISFKNAAGVVTKSVNFTQATHTRIGNVKGYYVFNLDDVDINNATQFDILIFLISNTSVGTEIPFVNVSFYYNFDNQIRYATFYSGLNVLGKQPFSILIPTPDFALPSGFSFWRWNNPDTGENEIFDINYAPKTDVVLRSGTTSTIVPPPVVPDPIGGLNNSFDTILSNTGFLNVSGILFIYFTLVIGIAVLIYEFKLSNFIGIILNILLTSLFLILGYLPLYFSILIIAFYIFAIISLNKGGFLNE